MKNVNSCPFFSFLVSGEYVFYLLSLNISKLHPSAQKGALLQSLYGHAVT